MSGPLTDDELRRIFSAVQQGSKRGELGRSLADRDKTSVNRAYNVIENLGVEHGPTVPDAEAEKIALRSGYHTTVAYIQKMARRVWALRQEPVPLRRKAPLPDEVRARWVSEHIQHIVEFGQWFREHIEVISPLQVELPTNGTICWVQRPLLAHGWNPSLSVAKGDAEDDWYFPPRESAWNQKFGAFRQHLGAERWRQVTD